jgi:hypothetical protein
VRMLDRKGLESQLPKANEPAYRHCSPISNGKSVKQCPGRARGEDGARRPLSQP